ncbi:hypothetical protein QAD02_003502 [Eretmocerus hayati]|uniref:Uncharacterized protein n=1 Tax=Eretmocerus hayati TaxID=131215 RepID=A0ACC2NN56_9HYME|nr:hypothetical protein QAD02_003502 [Eretmocerus hayati]
MPVNYAYAPMAIDELPLNRWLPVTKFKPFGDDKITMLLEDKVQIILPKHVTYWARGNKEKFLKLQDETRNPMLFIVAERNLRVTSEHTLNEYQTLYYSPGKQVREKMVMMSRIPHKIAIY